MTADKIAETYQKQLYTVPAGQIRVNIVRVERIPTTIFNDISRWKAVLLLDEAGLFLAQGLHDRHQNVLISVFLRKLEQCDGFLEMN